MANAYNEKDEEFHENRTKRVLECIEHIMDTKRRPKDYEKFTSEQHVDWINENLSDVSEYVSKYMKYYISGLMRSGDCGRSQIEKPNWLDMEKFKRGQKFGMDNLFATVCATLLGFQMVFTFKDEVRAIIMTKTSNTPYDSFYRYVKNMQSMLISYQSNPWIEGTKAYTSVRMIRRKHELMRKKFLNLSTEEINKCSKIENALCPMRDILMEDYRASCPAVDPTVSPYLLLEDKPYKPMLINQTDMGLAQFGFMGLLICYPASFGLSLKDQKGFDDFCHFWRGMGYVYGMEDEYNLCNGTFEEIQKRCYEIVENCIKPNLREITPEWEHLTRCLTYGINYYVPIRYEVTLLCISDLLGIEMPRFQASIDYRSWIQYKIIKWYFSFISKVPGVPWLMNKFALYKIENALNYSKEKLAKMKAESDKLILEYSSKNNKVYL